MVVGGEWLLLAQQRDKRAEIRDKGDCLANDSLCQNVIAISNRRLLCKRATGCERVAGFEEAVAIQQ